MSADVTRTSLTQIKQNLIKDSFQTFTNRLHPCPCPICQTPPHSLGCVVATVTRIAHKHAGGLVIHLLAAAAWNVAVGDGWYLACVGWRGYIDRERPFQTMSQVTDSYSYKKWARGTNLKSKPLQLWYLIPAAAISPTFKNNMARQDTYNLKKLKLGKNNSLTTGHCNVHAQYNNIRMTLVEPCKISVTHILSLAATQTVNMTTDILDNYSVLEWITSSVSVNGIGVW